MHTTADTRHAARDRRIRKRAARRIVGPISFRAVHKRPGWQQARDWCAATGDVGALARVLGASP